MDQADFGMSGRKLRLPRQLLRRPYVVRILDGNPVSACLPDRRIQSRVGAPVLLEAGADSVSVFREDFARIVRAAIVHDDNFMWRLGLIQNTVQAGAQMGTMVVARDDDADSHEVVSPPERPRSLSNRSGRVNRNPPRVSVGW